MENTSESNFIELLYFRKQKIVIIDSLVVQIMQLSSTQRKCLNIFKQFVQKALIPQIKSSSGSLAQWNIFQSLVSAPNPNINEIQYFVDNLPLYTSTKHDKTIFSKKQQQFQPISPLGKNLQYINKTFGGQIKRNTSTHNKQINFHQRRQSNRDEIIKQQKLAVNSGIMEGLQKMLKTLQENQKIIDYLSVEVQISMVKHNRAALNHLTYNMGGTVYNPHLYSTINHSGNNQSGHMRTSY